MYKKLFRFAVMTITILAANLITGQIGNILTGYRTHYKPLTFTLIAMSIIVLVLYPLFSHLHDWLSILSAKLVKSGRRFGGKYIGLVLIFLISFLVLLYFYSKMWYKIDILDLLFNGELQNYF